MARLDTPEQPISKLDAARRQIVTALRLFFESRDPVSVCTLAHAAREILDVLCRKRALDAHIDKISEDNNSTRAETTHLAEYGRNFFKHADRDPDATLDDFYDGRNDGVLFVAVQDLKTLCDNRLPIEAQAFEVWFAAAFPEKVLDPDGEYLGKIEALIPGFRKQSREELKKRTHELLQEALKDPSIMGHADTDVTETPRWG